MNVGRRTVPEKLVQRGTRADIDSEIASPHSDIYLGYFWRQPDRLKLGTN